MVYQIQFLCQPPQFSSDSKLLYLETVKATIAWHNDIVNIARIPYPFPSGVISVASAQYFIDRFRLNRRALRTFVHPSRIGKPGWTIDWQLAIKFQSIDVQRRNIKFLICQFWLDGKQADMGFLSFITIWNVALRRDFGKYRVQEVLLKWVKMASLPSP